jgi:hypothetical protein
MESTDSEVILEIVQDFVSRSYDCSKEDRKRLHEQEWQASASTSVLGEVEVRVDAILGALSTIQKKHPTREKVLHTLLHGSMFGSLTIRTWMLTQRHSYASFAAYIHAVEYLRLALLDMIQGDIF